MKKRNTIFSLLLVMMLLASPITVFATESTAASTETTEEYVSKAPWTYGEMKDGLFVRGAIEEMEWIGPEDPDYMKEWAICIEARRLDKLTPEMEALGYQLDPEGIVIEPGGDPSESEGSIRVEGSRAEENMTSYGQVTFWGMVDDEINAAGETCFIEVKNTTTGKSYIVDLFAVNGHDRTVFFPEGEYVPLAGGIYSDFTGKYPYLSEEFTVKNGFPAFVEVYVGNESVTKAKETREKEAATATPEVVEEDKQSVAVVNDVVQEAEVIVQKEKKSPVIKIVLVAGVLVAGYTLIKKKKMH